jgi:hypothetical protein
MDIVSLSPFRTGSLLWQPRTDRWTLTIVCKATYALEPGESGLCAEQEDVNEHENHWDDDPRRSLYAPSDLAPFKARADVMLVGHAFAPPSDPVRSLVARMKVGELDKAIEVFGPRVWTREGELREGTRWVKMPLRYERAAGGPATWNPVGVSAESPLDPYGQRPLPNLQRPGLTVTQPSDILGPVGFGPIASSWQLRRNQLGRHKDSWTERSLSTTPLEEDFDGAYFQAAPPDQQVDGIKDDESLTLEHLHPEHPLLHTRLSGVHPRVFVETGDAAPWDLVMTADTLWIDTDRSICTLTWRGQIGLGMPTQPGRVLVALEERGRRLSWANIAKIAAAGQEDDGGAAVPTDRRPRIQALRTLVSIGVQPSGTAEDAAPEPSRVEVVKVPAHLPSLRRTLPFSPGEPAPSPTAEAQRGASSRQTLTMEANPPQEIRSAIPAWVAPPQGAASTAAPPLGAAPPTPRQSAPAPLSTTAPLPPRPPSATAPGSTALPAANPPPRPPSAAPPPPPRPPSAAPPPPPAPPSLAELDPSSAPPPTPTAVATAPARNAPPGAPARVNVNASIPAPEPSVVQPTRMGGTPLERLVLVASPPPLPALELLWFEPAALTRVRAAWATVLRPLAPVHRVEDAAQLGMRADVSTVLVRAPLTDAATLEELMLDTHGEGGTLEAPQALLEGELELSLDPLEALRAAIGVATPLASADARLRETLDVASDAVSTFGRGARDVIEGLLTRVREDWAQVNRSLPASHLEGQVERVLLEARRYQQRELLDGVWIRALFQAPGAEPKIPLYLPAELARRLPLFRRFQARALVEVLPQQDQYEDCPIALRALALGRLVPGKRR